MTAAEIAAALGNARREGRDWRCCCPVHGGRSLTLRDGRDTLLIKCWAGCHVRKVLAELRRLRLLKGAVTTLSAGCHIDDRGDRERRIEIARQIWEAARGARGSPVVQYLAGRGVTMPVPAALRWASSLRRLDGSHGPAIVARVDGLSGELCALHRTWLDRDAAGVWRRRDRALVGPVSGGAVRLAPAAETLLIGEGIETTLAGMIATGLAGWASLSTSGLVVLRLPPVVRNVVILADHDRNGAGERAARAAARRWAAEGRRVQMYISPCVGEDAADRLLAVATGACHAA
jgi:putative DNA primase/helicase